MRDRNAETTRLSTLRAQLWHDKRSYRRDAIGAIARFELHELADDVMRCLMRESDDRVRARCAWTLGRLHHRPALNLLKTLMCNRNISEEVRTWAAWAVGEIGTTNEETMLSRELRRASSNGLRRAIGGALKKVRLESTRAPIRQVARQLNPPQTRNSAIRHVVDRLQPLEAELPRTLPTVVELRLEMKATDEGYFRTYMEWLERKPILERALTDPKVVYGN